MYYARTTKATLLAMLTGIVVSIGGERLHAEDTNFDTNFDNRTMDFRGGDGSIRSPLWFVGTLDKFDQRTYKFTKRLVCMRKGFDYIVRVKSYDFPPRLFLREYDHRIVVRGEVSTRTEVVKGKEWKVYSNELRYTPTHDEYVLEISHYNDDPEGARNFSMFIYRLPHKKGDQK